MTSKDKDKIRDKFFAEFNIPEDENFETFIVRLQEVCLFLNARIEKLEAKDQNE